jgi:Ca-activated chloride channel homolog
MTWLNPWFFIVLPVLLCMPWLKLQPSISFPSLSGLTQEKSWRLRLSWIPKLLMSLSAVFLVVALARPVIEKKERVLDQEGLDIMLVVDSSGSMEAEDYEFQGRSVSRMVVTKQVLSEFIMSRPNDRLGIVVFGEEAFTQTPLTLDHDGMQQFLAQIDVGLAGKSATAIGEGLAVAAQRLKELEAPSKIIILLTDGQSNAGIDPLAAADAAATLGIKIYTIGVGTEGRGGFFGLFQGGRSDLDENTLQEVSSRTGGQYFRAESTESLARVYRAIDQLEPSTAQYEEFVQREEKYPPYAIGGLLFLVFSLLLGEGIFRRLP